MPKTVTIPLTVIPHHSLGPEAILDYGDLICSILKNPGQAGMSADVALMSGRMVGQVRLAREAGREMYWSESEHNFFLARLKDYRFATTSPEIANFIMAVSNPVKEE